MLITGSYLTNKNSQASGETSQKHAAQKHGSQKHVGPESCAHQATTQQHVMLMLPGALTQRARCVSHVFMWLRGVHRVLSSLAMCREKGGKVNTKGRKDRRKEGRMKGVEEGARYTQRKA